MEADGKTVKVPLSEIFALQNRAAGTSLATPVLSLTVVSGTQINATWTSVSHGTNYKFYRSATPDINDSVLINGGGTGLTYSDTGLQPATSYWYWLIANGSGYVDSAAATGTRTTSGTGIDTTPPVFASWVINASNPYQIVATANEALTNIASANTSFFSIPGHVINAVVIAGTTVTITSQTPFAGGEAVTLSYSGNQIKDVAANLANTFSNLAVTNNITAASSKLPTPSLSAAALTATTVRLSWGPVVHNSGYELQQSANGASWTAFSMPAAGDLAADAPATGGTTVFFRLRALGTGSYETSDWAPASVTVPVSGSYDTVLTVDSSTSASAAGVHVSVQAVSSQMKLRFKSQTGGVSNNTLLIQVSGALKMVVDFPSIYIGQPFEFTAPNGAVYSGTFVDNTVNFQ